MKPSNGVVEGDTSVPSGDGRNPKTARQMSPAKKQNQNKTEERKRKTDPTPTPGKCKVAAKVKEAGEVSPTPIHSRPKKRKLSHLPKLLKTGETNPQEEMNKKPNRYTEKLRLVEPRVWNHLLTSVPTA